MAVKLVQMSSASGPVEDCVVCSYPTTMWWGDGCAPLCHQCANDKTHDDMVELSKKIGHGPIPEEDTNSNMKFLT